MTSWPVNFPPPLLDGYAINPADQTIRTDFEAGNKRARRRSMARSDQIQVSWRMTDAILATYRAWFENPAQANGGAAWFTISLPTGSGGWINVEARFAGPWTAKPIAGSLRWLVSAVLEIRYA